MTSAAWYLRRLSRMSPREAAGRAVTVARAHRWRSELDADDSEPVWLPERKFVTAFPSEVLAAVPADARARLLATADQLMDGRAEYLGVARCDMIDPDWSFDPRSGRRAPDDMYSFDIDWRDEQAVGNIKQILEPSRHHHLTVLAAAFALSGEDRYACRVADHLKSWWAANPPLRGVHWTSGIELGMRLQSWVWVRRLLDPWNGSADLFEDNPVALRQVWYHQRWLTAFRSHGSSANNHLIAELAGRLAAACAFPWFPESARWGEEALRLLDEQLQRNTFASGLNRELATDYHGLTLELGLAGAVEAEAAGLPVPDSTWQVLVRMTDALAAIVDAELRPPRQGDSDDGRALVLDGEETHRWGSLLATGSVLFGRLPWWPTGGNADVRTPLLAALVGPRAPVAGRPDRRPDHFADAGLTILRAAAGTAGDEIWCRCDGGPHGFLSIAAHAHADALSLEVRHGGVDVLADPGCYCYHGEPEWRSYFRSTLGHNTLELDERDQSTSGGPFLWTRHARSRVIDAPSGGGSDLRWSAEHDGYSRPGHRVVHRRSVELDGAADEILVRDEVLGRALHSCRLVFHLGPTVTAELSGTQATLGWTRGDRTYCARLTLPPELTWTAHRGETDPPLGWYSARFGHKEPSTALVGRGRIGRGTGALTTRLRFLPPAH
ncbi:alginate lyase family protein [Pseudonocardia yuanmonensis]|uniref:Alginate lyase family protein n=1 Tax=Pseudonocardia yuanmonensis TaxID=1095914 RepID=A0ABP8VW26_9PSEU